MLSKYLMNKKPINIHNLYIFLSNLYKLGIIPNFNVDFNNDLTEINYVFEYNDDKWERNGTSTIMYNINTKLWTSRFNTTTTNSKYIILQSLNIEDILEQSLNSFDIKNIESVNNKELHNVKYYNYYVFINNLMKEDQTSHFNKYKQMNDNLHEHLWDKIYNSYKINMSHIELKSFLAKYIV